MKHKREKECETLLCVVLCAAEGKHDRQQGCNFDTSFVSRRQTNLLARHLSLFLSLFRLHSFRVDPESLVAATGRSLIRLCLIRKEWKIARRLGCQSNSSSFLMNFFFIYFFFFFFIFSYFFLFLLTLFTLSKGRKVYTTQTDDAIRVESYITPIHYRRWE
jgi:hypothetical protein